MADALANGIEETNSPGGAIIALNPDGLSYEHACGATGIKALLGVAAKKKMHALQVDLRNSGDTAGSKDNVVGYGAFHFG